MENLVWCVSALFMAYAGYAKVRRHSQPIGARLIVVFCLSQVLAIIFGEESLAYVFNASAIAVALMLVLQDLRWKHRNRPKC